MVLHAPSLHFHIGAWFVTAICTFIAFWFSTTDSFLDYLLDRNVIKFKKRFGDDLVNKLDFVAHFCGIIGLLGIIGSAYLGLVDASGVELPPPFIDNLPNLEFIFALLDVNIALQGFESGMENTLLGFKITWTVVGIQLFLIAGIIRFYIVTLNKAKIYDTHIAIQIIYSGASMWGFIVMVAIAAVGGIYEYGESLMQEIPIVRNFLPGTEFSLLPALSIFFGFLAVMTLLSIFVFKGEKEVSPKDEKLEP